MSIQKIGRFASELIQAAMNSGLTWDESVAAFGMASKALANGAAETGDGPIEVVDCHTLAKKRFNEGFSQSIRLVFAGSDLTAFEGFSEQEREAVLANTNTKIFLKITH